jgi:hypothetical protein
MPKPQLSAIIALPINQAYICSECDVVMNQVQCPYCLTNNSAPLSTWLNRNIKNKIKTKTAIMRYAVLPEDEGRSELIMIVDSEEEAKEWIKNQTDEYFRPSDYYIMKQII